MPMPSRKYSGKRLLLWFLVLLAVLFVAASLFIRSADINDYSQWISEQIEESTGYQVHFQSIDENLYGQSRLSIVGFSLSLEQNELLYIEQINIEVKNFDLWQRQLEIEFIELSGIHIVADMDLFEGVIQGRKSTIATNLNPKKSAKSIYQLGLHRLHVNQFRALDLNADISNAEGTLHLREANLKSNNLLLIENNQLNTNLFTDNLQFDFTNLNIQKSAQVKLQIEGLSLQSEFSLLPLQATLLTEIQYVELDTIEVKNLFFDNVLLDLRVDKNKISLNRLFANAFTGQLDLQATASFVVTPFSSNVVSFKQLTVDSLLLKDMQLVIPIVNNPVSTEDADNKQPLVLPIESVFLQQVDVQNLNISSIDNQPKLTVNNLTSSVRDLYLVKENRLVSLPDKGTSSGFFTLKFDYLSWFDSEFEQFSIAGSLSKDDQSIMLIKKHFIKK